MRHIGNRLSYYKSKLISEQIASGERYDAIQRVICVCITSFELFPGVAEYVNGFRFYNPRNGPCFDGIPEEIYGQLPFAPEKLILPLLSNKN